MAVFALHDKLYATAKGARCTALFSRFARPKVAVLFISSYRAFFLLTHAETKAFSQLKALIFAVVKGTVN